MTHGARKWKTIRFIAAAGTLAVALLFVIVFMVFFFRPE
jgi:hypothetical protein